MRRKNTCCRHSPKTYQLVTVETDDSSLEMLGNLEELVRVWKESLEVGGGTEMKNITIDAVMTFDGVPQLDIRCWGTGFQFVARELGRQRLLPVEF